MLFRRTTTTSASVVKATNTQNAVSTTSSILLLVNAMRSLNVSQRSVNQRRRTHQQLSKPKSTSINSNNDTGEHSSPSSSMASSSTNTTTYIIREKEEVPIITMPSASSQQEKLQQQKMMSNNVNNNQVLNRPLPRLFQIISQRISEQEQYEEEQQKQQLEQEKKKEKQMNNDQKAVFFNRYSSSNFGAFANTAEEIIKEFRSTFKLPTTSAATTSSSHNEEKTASELQKEQEQQQKLLTSSSNSSLPKQQKKKKMSTSTHHQNQDPNNSLVLQQQQNGNNNNEENSSSSALLANYCGSSEDVLQLAMIVMQSCVDVAEVATARLLFALVIREVPFHVIPFQFFRLYFLALSRSDSTTLEEFNGLVQLIGGRAAVKHSPVIALCILEVKMRIGFNVSLAEVEEAIFSGSSVESSSKQEKDQNDENKKNSSKSTTTKQATASSSSSSTETNTTHNNNTMMVSTPSFFMMSEDSEKRLKLRDCFLVAVRSNPDPAVATLLLREWTKLSDLNEFMGEMNTIVNFLLVATNNTAASPSLCAELISLLEGLVQNNNTYNDQQQQQQNQGAATTATTKQTLTSLITLKTLVKTAAKAIRAEDWKSFLTIEKFTRELFLFNNVQQQQHQNNVTNESSTTTTTSPEVLAIITSTLSIFRTIALIETNQYDQLLSSPSSSENQQTITIIETLQKRNLSSTIQYCPQLFTFNKKEDLDSNICPFFVDKLMLIHQQNVKQQNNINSNNGGGEDEKLTSTIISTTTPKMISDKRIELAKLVNFPISDFPPMTLLLETLLMKKNNNATGLILERGFRKRKNNDEEEGKKNIQLLSSSSSPALFVETLTLLTASIAERSKNLYNTTTTGGSGGGVEEVISILKMYFSDQFSTTANSSNTLLGKSMTMSSNSNNGSNSNTNTSSAKSAPFQTHLEEILFTQKAHFVILNSALTYLRLISGSLYNLVLNHHHHHNNINKTLEVQQQKFLAEEIQTFISYLVDDVVLNEEFFEKEVEERGSQENIDIAVEVKVLKRNFLLEMANILRKNNLSSTCEELEKMAMMMK